MKKTIIVIMMVVGGMMVNCQELDHGLITGFEVGYNLIDRSWTFSGAKRGTTNREHSDSLSLELKTGYRISNFRIIGTYENTMLFLNIDQYDPVRDKFKIEITYALGNLTLGFEHWCSHPVITDDKDQDYYENSSKRQFYVKYYKEF